MNSLQNRNTSDRLFCSKSELIPATGRVNARTATAKWGGNGISPAVKPATAGVPAQRAPGSPGSVQTFPEAGASDSLRRIEQSIAYMMNHLHQPLDVSTLAASASLSTSHFFALFKRQTGCAPMGYFTHLRMQHACQLLDGTSASVKEVAAALGYEDPFYFSRVFKLVNHVPPSQYRAMQKPRQGMGRNQAAPVPLPENKHQNQSIVHSLQSIVHSL